MHFSAVQHKDSGRLGARHVFDRHLGNEYVNGSLSLFRALSPKLGDSHHLFLVLMNGLLLVIRTCDCGSFLGLV